MTFLRKRIVPAMPPSFVKFRASVLGVIRGSGVSIPMSDHVPELRKAQSPSHGRNGGHGRSRVMAGRGDDGTDGHPVSAADVVQKAAEHGPGRSRIF